MIINRNINYPIIVYTAKPFFIVDWGTQESLERHSSRNDLTVANITNATFLRSGYRGISRGEAVVQEKRNGTGIRDTTGNVATMSARNVQVEEGLDKRIAKYLYVYTFSFNVNMSLLQSYNASILRITFYDAAKLLPANILNRSNTKAAITRKRFFSNKLSLHSNRANNTRLLGTKAIAIQDFDLTYLINNQIQSDDVIESDISHTLVDANIINRLKTVVGIGGNPFNVLNFNFANSDNTRSGDRSQILDDDSKAGSTFPIDSDVSTQNQTNKVRNVLFHSMLQLGQVPSQFYSGFTKNLTYTHSGLNGLFTGRNDPTTALQRLAMYAGNVGQSLNSETDTGVVVVNRNFSDYRPVVVEFTVDDPVHGKIPDSVRARLEVIDFNGTVIQLANVDVSHSSLKAIPKRSVAVDLKPQRQQRTLSNVDNIRKNAPSVSRESFSVGVNDVVTDRRYSTSSPTLSVLSKRVDSKTGRTSNWNVERNIDGNVKNTDVTVVTRTSSEIDTVDTTDATIIRVKTNDGSNILGTESNFKDVVVFDYDVSDTVNTRGSSRFPGTKFQQLPMIYAVLDKAGSGITVKVNNIPSGISFLMITRLKGGKQTPGSELPGTSTNLKVSGWINVQAGEVTFFDDVDLQKFESYRYTAEYRTAGGIEGSILDSYIITYTTVDKSAKVSVIHNRNGLSIKTDFDPNVTGIVYATVLQKMQQEFADVAKGFDTTQYPAVPFYRITRVNTTSGYKEGFYSGGSNVVEFKAQEKLLNLTPSDSSDFLYEIETYLQIPNQLLPLIKKASDTGTLKEYQFSELEFFNKETLETGKLTKDFSKTENVDDSILYLGSPAAFTSLLIKGVILKSAPKIKWVNFTMESMNPPFVKITWKVIDPDQVIDHFIIKLNINNSSIEVGYVSCHSNGTGQLVYNHSLTDVSLGLLINASYEIIAMDSQYKVILSKTLDKFNSLPELVSILNSSMTKEGAIVLLR